MDYDYWRSLSSDELAKQDIGRMNLVASQGAPGVGEFGLEERCQQLTTWAATYQRGLEKYWPKRRLLEYCQYSPGQFKILILFTILQRDLGVHYEPFHMTEDYDARDGRFDFIIGPLTGTGGTCCSLPVLFVAVGRRAGLPLELVRAKEHLFVRWEGDGEQFDIEATSRGYKILPPGHFLHSPAPLTKEDIAKGVYLTNMSPAQSFGCFVHQRGRCLLDNFHFAAAIRALECAHTFDPIYHGDLLLARMESLIMQRYHEAHLKHLPFPERLERACPDPWTPGEAWAVKAAQNDLQRMFRNLRTRQLPPLPQEPERCTTQQLVTG